MKRFCRRRLVARIVDLQSADGSSILLAGAMCPVRPMDQDRTLRTFRFGFESRAGYQVYGVVAERQRHLTVYEDQVGSTPIHFAKLRRRRQAGLSRLILSQEIAGLNPAVVASAVRVVQGRGSDFLNRKWQFESARACQVVEA